MGVTRHPMRVRANVRDWGRADEWWVRVLLRARDLPAYPSGSCGPVCGRNPCDHCFELQSWEQAVVAIARLATGLRLDATETLGPGNVFREPPTAGRVPNHRGVIEVTWCGGVDL